jgi:hypothetical protein
LLTTPANSAGLAGDRQVSVAAECGKLPLVAQIDPPTDAIVGDWLTIPEVAGQLGLPGSRV